LQRVLITFAMATTDTLGAEPFNLTPAEELLATCPKFRLLVLGNIESTKIEIFSSVLGIKLDKVSRYGPKTASRSDSN
jgi:hypothetical protein